MTAPWTVKGGAGWCQLPRRRGGFSRNQFLPSAVLWDLFWHLLMPLISLPALARGVYVCVCVTPKSFFYQICQLKSAKAQSASALNTNFGGAWVSIQDLAHDYSPMCLGIMGELWGIMGTYRELWGNYVDSWGFMGIYGGIMGESWLGVDS